MSDTDEAEREKWNFEHSVECQASRDFAWRFWTNIDNWAVVDPAVESAALDGPFAAGTKGTTITRDSPPVEWQIIEVHEGSSARIEIPAPGAVVKCFWKFEESASGGTRITQRMSLEGEKADDYVATLAPAMENGIPQGMQKLANAVNRAASEQA